jgi:hypothetical protein
MTRVFGNVALAHHAPLRSLAGNQRRCGLQDAPHRYLAT